ncbi:MAG: type II toxin-antitoxin system RelE/ParE family toxin [Atopobiaceae bacterium]|nr:type II toxin-antitoxin system RelE/ParE family toxin [Atopobiaceae bacterium]
MSFHVEYSKTALKQLKKMDRFDARLITSWIGKNLEECEDTRAHGKGLTANRSGEWRYRVGNYRILCVIEDDVLVIEVFSIGHGSVVYKYG